MWDAPRVASIVMNLLEVLLPSDKASLLSYSLPFCAAPRLVNADQLSDDLNATSGVSIWKSS